MKHFSLLPFLILISCIQLNAQSNEFAPVGAKWWYDFYPMEGPEYGYVFMESKNDTVINDINCRQLARTLFIYHPYTADIDTIYQQSYFVYSEYDTVYYLDDAGFFPLYDFNAIPGDTWNYDAMAEFECPDSPYYIIHVIDTGWLTNGSDSLKSFTMESPDSSNIGWSYGMSEVAEKTGSLNYFFPGFLQCPTDDYTAGPLRCYQDSSTFFAFYDDEDTAVTTYGCDPFVFIDGISSNVFSAISIYPNPASAKIFIDMNLKDYDLVECFNISGTKINFKLNMNTTDIPEADISDLPDGIYFLRIMKNNHPIKTGKFVKY